MEVGQPSDQPISGLTAGNPSPGLNIFALSESAENNAETVRPPLEQTAPNNITINLLCRQPDDVLREISLWCGREASYMLRSTCKYLYHYRTAALEGQFHEPFTYADWKGLTQHDWTISVDRRSSILGRNRRSGQKHRGRQRWLDFKASIAKWDGGRYAVRRIAMSHWMLLEDYVWIAKELPALEALDLSDLGEDVWYPDGSSSDEYVAPDEGYGWRSRKHSIAFKRANGIEDEVPPYWDEIERAIQDAGSWPVKLSDDELRLLDHMTDADREQYWIRAVILYQDVRNWARDKSLAERAGAKLNKLSMALLKAENAWADKMPALAAKVARAKDRMKDMANSHNIPELPDDSTYRSLLERNEPPNLFNRLKWLGLRNWADIRYSHLSHYKSKPSEPWSAYTLRKSDMLRPTYGSWTFLQKCKNLETLSIRGFYEPDDPIPSPRQIHWNICAFIDPLLEHVSHTVKTLELRQSIEWIDLLLQSMASTTNITRVGLDIGALLQIYPLAAYSNKDLNVEREIKVPAMEYDPDEVRNEEARCSDQKHDAMIERMKFERAATVSQCLVRLAAAFERWPVIKAFALSPEIPDTRELAVQPRTYDNILWPHPSCTSVLSPLTLVESFAPAKRPINFDNVARGTARIPREQSITDFRPTSRLPSVYKWLHTNLNWQPTFDWTDLMEETLPTQNTKFDVPKTPSPLQLDQIRSHFTMLKAAQIPLHLLLGNRKGRPSSLYWGAPFHEKQWKAWLATPFDIHLAPIAPSIDKLSIFYALAEPLDAPTIARIAAHSPLLDALDTTALTPQIMANKRTLGPRRPRHSPKPVLPATGCPAAPPPGATPHAYPHEKHAGPDHAFPVPDPADASSLHQLARTAAYEREALGWQRFWKTYALEFSALTLLRIRMPKSFDSISSWRLARLLDRDVGWDLLLYFDERVYAAGHRGLLPPSGRAGAPGRTRPGLTFVRRSWVWDGRWLEAKKQERGVSRAKRVEYASQEFGKAEWDDTEVEERKEERKARNRAEDARRAEVGWMAPEQRAAVVAAGERAGLGLGRRSQPASQPGDVPLGRFAGVSASYVHGAEGVDLNLEPANGPPNVVTVEEIQFEATDSQGTTSHEESTGLELESTPLNRSRVVRLSRTPEPPHQSLNGPVRLGASEAGRTDDETEEEMEDIVLETEDGVRLTIPAFPTDTQAPPSQLSSNSPEFPGIDFIGPSGVHCFIGPASTAASGLAEASRKTQEEKRAAEEKARAAWLENMKVQEERQRKLWEEKRRVAQEDMKRLDEQEAREEEERARKKKEDEEWWVAERARIAKEATVEAARSEKEEEGAAWKEAEQARLEVERMEAQEAEVRRAAAELERLGVERKAALADMERRAIEQAAADQKRRMAEEVRKLQEKKVQEEATRKQAENEQRRLEGEEKPKKEEEARMEEERIVRESKQAFDKFVEEHTDRGHDLKQGFLLRWADRFEKWMARKQGVPYGTYGNQHPAEPERPLEEIVQDVQQAEETVHPEEARAVKRVSEQMTLAPPAGRRSSVRLKEAMFRRQQAERNLEKAKSEAESVRRRHEAEKAAEEEREEHTLLVMSARTAVAEEQVANAKDQIEKRLYEEFAKREAQDMCKAVIAIQEKRRRSSQEARTQVATEHVSIEIVSRNSTSPVDSKLGIPTEQPKEEEAPSPDETRERKSKAYTLELDYNTQTVVQLRALLKMRKISSTGLRRKAQIVEMLRETDRAALAGRDTEDVKKVQDGDAMQEPTNNAEHFDVESSVEADQGVKRAHDEFDEGEQPKAKKANTKAASVKVKTTGKGKRNNGDAVYKPEPETPPPPRRSGRIQEMKDKT